MSRKKQKTESFGKRDKNPTNQESNVGKIVSSSLFLPPFWNKLDAIDARNLHCEYMSKYLDALKKIVFIWMNSGAFGMCQTRVPFGHAPTVRDWMKLTSDVEKPVKELIARPVDGLKCTKVEQSGLRWWGLIKDVYGAPEQFFKHCIIYNYCPLTFFASGGRNITPAEIKGEPMSKLQEICNKHLQDPIHYLHPEIIISIGKYAEYRVKDLQKKRLLESSITQKCIPHPSPRSLNNTDWPSKARNWFEKNRVMPFLKN